VIFTPFTTASVSGRDCDSQPQSAASGVTAGDGEVGGVCEKTAGVQAKAKTIRA